MFFLCIRILYTYVKYRSICIFLSLRLLSSFLDVLHFYIKIIYVYKSFYMHNINYVYLLYLLFVWLCAINSSPTSMIVLPHERLSEFLYIYVFFCALCVLYFLCFFKFVYLYVFSMYIFLYFVYIIMYVHNQSIYFFYDFGVRLVYTFLVFVFPIILVCLCRYVSMSI